MEAKRLNRHIMLYILIAGICMLAMVDTDIFCYPSLSTSLLPDFLICCLSIITLGHIALVRYAVSNSGGFFLLTWILFVGIYSLFVPCEYYRLIYLLSSLLFAVDLICLSNKELIRWEYVESFFLLEAFVQLFSILLQVIHIAPSGSDFFSVTGLNENPSATAVFLALCLPLGIKRLNVTKGKRKILFLFFLLVMLAAIIALKCRTAYVGSVIALAVSYFKQLKYQVQKMTFSCRLGLLGLIVGVFLFSGYYLYNMKEKSSDGRMLIWKNTIQMILEKPQGYGYGMFERDYNLKQSAYFLNGKNDEQEIMLADHVFMPYNDTLEQCVEGGFLGGFFYPLFYVVMICKSYKRRKYETLAVALSAFVMSMFNFLYTYPVVWLLLMCNYAETCFGDKIIRKRKSYSLWYAYALVGVIGIFVIMLMSKNLEFIKAQCQLRRINQLLDKNIIVDDEYIASLKEEVSTSELYYTSLAKNFLLEGKYDRAIDALLVAKEYTSSPSVYLSLASCYARMGNIDNALHCTLIAKGIVPHHFMPEIILLRLYVKCGESEKALAQAHYIQKKPIKVHSEKVDKIKNEALKYIQAYEK